MPDPGGPARFFPLAPGADPTSHPGAGAGLGLLAPTEEPAVVSQEPPVPPDVIPSGSVSRRVRRVRSVCGSVSAFPRSSRARPRFTVRWTGLDAAELDMIRAYLVVTCGNGESSFPVRPDGDTSDPIAVRALSSYSYEEPAPGVYVIELQVEAAAGDVP